MNEINKGITIDPIDADYRVESFNKELVVILKKYKLGMGCKPELTNDGRISARLVVFDDTGEKKKE